MSLNNSNRLIFSYIPNNSQLYKTLEDVQKMSAKNENVILFSDFNNTHVIYKGGKQYSTNVDDLKQYVHSEDEKYKNLTYIAYTVADENLSKTLIDRSYSFSISKMVEEDTNIKTYINNNFTRKSSYINFKDEYNTNIEDLYKRVNYNAANITGLQQYVNPFLNGFQLTEKTASQGDFINLINEHYNVSSNTPVIFKDVPDGNGNTYTFIHFNSFSGTTNQGSIWVKFLTNRAITSNDIINSIDEKPNSIIFNRLKDLKAYIQNNPKFANLTVDSNLLAQEKDDDPNTFIHAAISYFNINTPPTSKYLSFITLGNATVSLDRCVKRKEKTLFNNNEKLDKYKVASVLDNKIYIGNDGKIELTMPTSSDKILGEKELQEQYVNKNLDSIDISNPYTATTNVWPYINKDNHTMAVASSISLFSDDSNNYTKLIAQAGLQDNVEIKLPVKSGTLLVDGMYKPFDDSKTRKYYLVGHDIFDYEGVMFRYAKDEASGFPFIVGNNLYYRSDKRCKTNISFIDKELENKIWNNDNLIKTFKYKKDNKYSYGFIAQELEKIVPELVEKDNNSYLSINYNSAFSLLIGTLIDKVKELEHKIEILEKH